MTLVGELLDQGLIHHRAGRTEAAEAAYRAVLDAEPGNAEAHHLMGMLAFAAKDAAAAIDRFSRAAAIAPATAKYHGNLGAALLSERRMNDAVASLEAAHELDSDSPNISCNLAAAWTETGRADEAIVLCRDALERAPDDAALGAVLTAALLRIGRPEEALAEAERGLTLAPDDVALLNVQGAVLRALGRFADSLVSFERVVTLDPTLFEGWVNLGFARDRMRRYDAAILAFEQALSLRPDNAEAQMGLANILRFQGRKDEALKRMRQAVEHAPANARFHSMLLFHMLGDPDIDAAALCDAHREWDARHGSRGKRPIFDNVPDPDRPLRIGYVSGDFINHPVGRLIAPVIAAHDRGRVTPCLYALNGNEDDVTRKIRGAGDVWRDVEHLDDDGLAATVRADAIDILVDLAGHTGYNRMTAFARRLAPVQASWLGYQATTGLGAVDWVITDSTHLPDGCEAEIVERPMRLPHGLLVFVPPGDAPPVAPAPVATEGTVTFCSFNNPGKISPACIDAWGQVLAAVPNSRLLLRYRGLEDGGVRESLQRRLATAGITPDRILFEGNAAYGDVLRTYARCDIALDTFPYSGTMTTLEALWMGVPVVALRGDRMAGRQAAGQLAAAGLPELIADDVAGYVVLAAQLARDPARLRTMRETMRATLLASPLCDVAGFTAGLEGALRTMWRDWCAGQARL